MKTLKFRARFRSISNGGECWQFSMINEETTNSSFVRISEWEQFTGLKDKNDKEIYEGDIVDFGNNNPVQVIFYNGSFCVFNEPLGWDFDSEDYPEEITYLTYCEIIGNVHENQELLTKQS